MHICKSCLMVEMNYLRQSPYNSMHTYIHPSRSRHAILTGVQTRALIMLNAPHTLRLRNRYEITIMNHTVLLFHPGFGFSTCDFIAGLHGFRFIVRVAKWRNKRVPMGNLSVSDVLVCRPSILAPPPLRERSFRTGREKFLTFFSLVPSRKPGIKNSKKNHSLVVATNDFDFYDVSTNSYDRPTAGRPSLLTICQQSDTAKKCYLIFINYLFHEVFANCRSL